MEKVESVFIEARSWFDKANGNSYYSARVWVNGRVVGQLPFSYGYGEQYRYDSLRALKTVGFLKDENGWYVAPDGSPVVIYASNSWHLKRDLFGAMDFETYGTAAA